MTLYLSAIVKLFSGGMCAEVEQISARIKSLRSLVLFNLNSAVLSVNSFLNSTLSFSNSSVILLYGWFELCGFEGWRSLMENGMTLSSLESTSRWSLSSSAGGDRATIWGQH